ncbi:hypothetical protein D3C87_941680 [compost metagenome]
MLSIRRLATARRFPVSQIRSRSVHVPKINLEVPEEKKIDFEIATIDTEINHIRTLKKIQMRMFGGSFATSMLFSCGMIHDAVLLFPAIGFICLSHTIIQNSDNGKRITELLVKKKQLEFIRDNCKSV